MAVATLAQIRAGLKTRLDTISGLQTYQYLPADPMLPCAFVGSPREVTYHDLNQSGLNIWRFSVWALVSTATPSQESQTDLDLFVSPSGTYSIKAAIEGTHPQTLSGIVADVLVESCSGYAIYTTESGSYFGAEFVVVVYAGA